MSAELLSGTSRSPGLPQSPRGTTATGTALDGLVCELNDIFRSGTMGLHVRLGRVIIEMLYGGDLARWRAKGTKDLSFRKLASRANRDLAISVSSLCRAVALCELTDRLEISTWKHLGVSHLRGVLGLPDREQRRLLAIAETEAWTVERLEKEKAKVSATQTRRRGRRRMPAFVKTVHRLMKLLDEPEQSFGGLDELNQVDENEIARLLGVISSTKDRLEILERHLLGDRPRTGKDRNQSAAGAVSRPGA